MDGAENPSERARIQTATDLMPSEPSSVAVLQARYEALSQRDSGPEDSMRVQLLRVRLDSDVELAIPVDHLDEVLVAADITRVPHAPAAVIGVVGHRGAILAVVDLGSLLGLHAAAPGPQALVIVSAEGHRIALAVPEVVGMESASAPELAPAPNLADKHGGLLCAVLGGSIGVLDVSRVVRGISA